jgi:hypothetical protein
MKTYILVSLFAFLILLAPLEISSAMYDQQHAEQVSTGKSVLLGTWTWDAETDSFPFFSTPNHKRGDIWWEQAGDNKQNLIAQNGAVLAEIREVKFEDVTPEYLAGLEYTLKVIAGARLTPGAIIGIRTAEGNHVKLKVMGYRALHDFSFKEAENLSPGWRAFVLGKDDKKRGTI